MSSNDGNGTRSGRRGSGRLGWADFSVGTALYGRLTGFACC